MTSLQSYTNELLILAGGGIALLIVLYFLFRERSLPYEKIPFLFTPAEIRFLKALDQSISDYPDLRVFGKVRIADVLKVTKQRKKRNFWRYFTKISSKHLDYVITHTKTLEPLVAIELDDSSHQRKDRIERDIFVNKACEAANLPLLRFPVQKSYELQAIQVEIENALKKLG